MQHVRSMCAADGVSRAHEMETVTLRAALAPFLPPTLGRFRPNHVRLSKGDLPGPYPSRRSLELDLDRLNSCGPLGFMSPGPERPNARLQQTAMAGAASSHTQVTGFAFKLAAPGAPRRAKIIHSVRWQCAYRVIRGRRDTVATPS